MSLIEHILRLIAPNECLNCGAEDNLLCNQCAGALPAAVIREKYKGIDTVWAVTRYEGVAKTLVHMLKFERAAAAADDIARAMARQLPAGQWIVTSVPTAVERVRQRGYDQSRLIARALATQNNLLYLPLLARVSSTRQVGATRAVRKEQMYDAFRPLRHQTMEGAPILLVDDVLTTGGTVEAAAAVLRANGARSVSAAVFAAA
ncbi:MAG TPA: phosphoribosyltransferase family protein [Patescibacteria group bacterium]|nr:phosphoribosyltransferase family protein [Patescibacteria group bacterium]